MQCSMLTQLCVSADSPAPSTDATIDSPAEAALLTDSDNRGDTEVSPEMGAYDSSRQDVTSADGESGTISVDSDGAGDGPGCQTTMCKCAGAGDCMSGICASELTIGTPLFHAAGSESFCTKPCCSSADCDSWTVCYATSNGGNYCVLPSLLDRSMVLGTGLGGRSCQNNTECRSGWCPSGTCVDTCCSSTNRNPLECAGAGITCALSAFPGHALFDRAFVANCGFGGGAKAGTNCVTADDCQSGACDERLMRICRNLCRNSTDCSTGLACTYTAPSPPRGMSSFPPPAPVVAVCSPSAGNKAEGAPCTSDLECQSAFCNQTSKLCTDVCFTDMDCTFAGWRCRPEQVIIGSGGAASVLCCGP
jgi:hypothetical protein